MKGTMLTNSSAAEAASPRGDNRLRGRLCGRLYPLFCAVLIVQEKHACCGFANRLNLNRASGADKVGGRVAGTPPDPTR